MKPLMIYAGVIFFLFSCTSQKNSLTKTDNLQLLLLNGEKLRDLKSGFDKNLPEATRSVAALLFAADSDLRHPDYSVTFHKDSVAPTGDKRDYISMGPYWWPDPKKPDGKPYIRRDGEINPEREKLKDHEQLGNLTNDVLALALAYYFTKKDVYAKRAIQMTDVWFVNPETRMNPNLNYGQGIPGITLGRGIGIIETRLLTNIPDALTLMADYKHMPPSLIAEVKKWYGEYLNWLISSPIGLDEQHAKNNHGTYYDVQVADFALFTGNKDLAKQVFTERSAARMDTQFTIGGEQPLELERTKSFSYSAMNLLGWMQLATLAEKVNVDLWNMRTPSGKSINKTLKWFEPFLLENKKWASKQISEAHNEDLFAAYKLAEDKYRDDYIKRVKTKYEEFDWVKLW